MIHMKAKLGLSFVASTFIFGCTTVKPPEVTLEPNASLARYKDLAVASVTIEQGQSLDPKLADELAVDLTTALKTKGYGVTDYNSAPAGSLIVQCSYVSYRPGNAVETSTVTALMLASAIIPGAPLVMLPLSHAGDILATVSVTLVDKNTAKQLGDMVVVKELPPGPAYGSEGFTSGKHY